MQGHRKAVWLKGYPPISFFFSKIDVSRATAPVGPGEGGTVEQPLGQKRLFAWREIEHRSVWPCNPHPPPPPLVQTAAAKIKDMRGTVALCGDKRAGTYQE